MTVAVIAMTMGTRLLAAVLPVVLVGNGAGRGQSLVAAPVAGGDPLPGHALDVAQQAALVLGAEGNCLAVSAGTGGAAAAVHIAFRPVRQLEVHHMADAGDVDSAGGDKIGRAPV